MRDTTGGVKQRPAGGSVSTVPTPSPDPTVTVPPFVPDDWAHEDGGYICTTCHVPPAGAHYGVSRACESCHEYPTWDATHPAREDCASCHVPPRGHYGSNCTGCHDPDRPWDSTVHTQDADCASCHDAPHRGGYPVGCTSCHPRVGDTWVPPVHTDYPACTACHTRPAGHPSGQCSSCHSPDDPWSDADHPADASSCQSCHERPHRDYAPSTCTSCHNVPPDTWVPIDHPQDRDDCRACHNPPHRGYLPSACTDCHTLRPGTGWLPTAHPDRTDCLSCHTPPHRSDYPVACTSCHPMVGEAWLPPVHTDSTTCESCHSSSDTPTTNHPGSSCSRCHEPPPDSWVDGSHPSAASTCQNCHTPQHAGPWPATGCMDCHADVGDTWLPVTHPDRTDCLTCHTPPHRTDYPVACESCHPMVGVAWLPPVHTGSTACESCHESTDTATTDHPAASCSNCHEAPPAAWSDGGHPSAASICRNCHTPQHVGPWTSLACAQCHTDVGNAWMPVTHPNRTDCLTCHAVKADTPTTNHPDTGCASCHPVPPAAWTDATHPLDGSGSCASCHVPPAAHYGANCDSCHDPARPWNQPVHPDATSDCTACHTAPHMDYSPSECVDCHTQHGVAWTAVHPDRTDCSSCHPNVTVDTHPFSGCETCHTTPVSYTSDGSHYGTTIPNPGCGSDGTSNYCHNLEHRYNNEMGIWGSGPFSCAYCHDNPAFPNVPPGDGPLLNHSSNPDCLACHQRTADTVTTTHPATACGTCHPVKPALWTDATHPADGSGSCSSCHVPPAAHYGPDCDACHAPAVPWADATVDHTVPGLLCEGCHAVKADTVTTNHPATACADCHAIPPSTWADATHPAAASDCLACHRAAPHADYAPSACADCHVNVGNNWLAAHTDRTDCVSCHPTVNNDSHVWSGCESCHTTPVSYTSDGSHNGSTVPNAASCGDIAGGGGSNYCHNIEHLYDNEMGRWGSGPFSCTYCHGNPAFPNVPPASPTVPVAPSFTSVAPSNGQVSLAWIPVPNATGYNLQRSAFPDFSAPVTLLANSTALAYASTGLINGTTYHYRVQAVNALSGAGPWTSASATPVAPAPLGTLTATPEGTGWRLAWSGGSAPYEVLANGAVRTTASTTNYLFEPVPGAYSLQVRDSLGGLTNTVAVDSTPPPATDAEFPYSVSPRTFTVPAGVTSVHVVIRGAGGGAGGPSVDDEVAGGTGQPSSLSSVTHLGTTYRADGGGAGIGATDGFTGSAGIPGSGSTHAGFSTVTGGGATGDIGTDADPAYGPWFAYGGNGGAGGRLTGDIAVVPGSTLSIITGRGGRSAWWPSDSYGQDGSVSMTWTLPAPPSPVASPMPESAGQATAGTETVVPAAEGSPPSASEDATSTTPPAQDAVEPPPVTPPSEEPPQTPKADEPTAEQLAGPPTAGEPQPPAVKPDPPPEPSGETTGT